MLFPFVRESYRKSKGIMEAARIRVNVHWLGTRAGGPSWGSKSNGTVIVEIHSGGYKKDAIRRSQL